MAYEHKPNTGTLWPNEKKSKPTDPDMTGNIMESDGTLLNLAVWKQTKDKDGNALDKPRMNVKTSPKLDGSGNATPKAKPKEDDPFDF